MKRKLRGWAALLAIVAIGTALIFTGCPDDGTSEKGFSITVTVTGNGTVTPSATSAEEGVTITLAIVPADGHQLKENSLTVKNAAGTALSISGSGDERTFKMPASNVTVSVEFEPEPAKTYTITRSGIQNGTVTITPALATGQTGYEEGTPITLTIAPNEGYEFTSITAKTGTTDITLTGSGLTRTFTMPEGHVIITAVFTGIPHSIQLNNPANGSIEASKNSAIIGETITLTLTAPGYKVKSITVNGDASKVRGGGSIRTFSMPAANVAVAVEYEILTGPSYTISIPAAQVGGSIDVDPVNKQAREGQFVDLTVNVTTGYKLVDFSIKDASNEEQSYGVSGTTYSFDMPASNAIVSADWPIDNSTEISIAFDGFEDEEIDLSADGTVLSQSNYDSVYIRINGTYDNYFWFIDGVEQDQYDNDDLLIYAYDHKLGKRRVLAIVFKNGVPYSKELTFEVVW